MCMYEDTESGEIWLDTEGTVSAGYYGDINIVIDLRGSVCFNLF